MSRMSLATVTRVSVVLLWVLAALISVALIVARYRSAIADGTWFDFTNYFLPAGLAVTDGRPPYDVDGYVYSPIIAVLVGATLGFPEPITVWTILSLGAAVGAIALFTATIWHQLRPWQRPCIAAVAVITLMWNWLTTLMLGSGQTDLYVMVALCGAGFAASRRNAVATGAGIAIAALMKTWPIIVGIWMFRRGASKRWTTLIAAFVTGSVALVVIIVIWGPEAISAWADAVLRARSQPGLIHFNVLSMGEQIFGGGKGAVSAPPTFPALAIALTIVSILVIVSALIVALLWPGDDLLSLWHVTLAVVLLLPVTHSVYLILGLPILWVRFARFLSRPRRSVNVVTLAIWILWWVASARVQWSGDTFTTMSTVGYATVMALTMIALVVSVILEARVRTRNSGVAITGA